MDYVAMAGRVRKMLTRNGAPITLTRVTPSDYDRTTGAKDDFGDSTFTGVAVQANYSIALKDGTKIQRGDARMLMSIDVQPLPGDKLDFSGQSFKVVNADPIAPGGTVVLYDVQVRQ